ncbi:PQQ-binding-like beta-propeller repeat protein [Chitinophaga filiformis]|uniref:PQQ-binding-like beta-propeller repeat protein n=1 Tax=Chitinophaga filiformis TaxID=104663 RepID=A0ABY4I2C2_CHIFI|nr:PQQ-binding-like beta-propeller repeat protein [Chitinophaga filiformis]UPK69992.1 PQQ-binding-like beta-propeller repeat protein [Chitinophaga filiformis]
MRNLVWLVSLSTLLILTSCKDPAATKDYNTWATYAGSKDGIRYSANTQINPDNVSRLQVAWTYSTHDKDTAGRSQNQCNPVMVDGILYGLSPRLKLFALNAATGIQQWLFDPASEDTAARNDPAVLMKVSRGVVYWQSKDGKDKRIFYNAGNRTYAINAVDGKPVRSFGKGGYIDLSEHLDRQTEGDAYVSGNTPGIIYKDLLIMGSRVAESADAAPGHIRAFDVRTGGRRWIFHTIPHPGETGYDTWPDKDAWKKLGGANSWAGMSLDEERGIVYVPTGSIGGDFYGGFRKGSNLFANSLVALDAATGKYLWHYQVVHHDLWDRDLAANPNLVTLHKDGKTIDAVAQITKHGYIFLFDRTNGQPVFPIAERAVPQEALPGETPWPTQPVPVLPEPFARQQFSEEDLTDLSPEAHQEMLEQFRKVKYSAMFAPPSKESSWIFPGFDGGGEWGGAAVDPETQILYVNSTELPWTLTMIDAPGEGENDATGHNTYNKYCISCHGPELKGNGTSYPSLVNIGRKYPRDQIRKIIESGRNMMPSFRQIPDEERAALIDFLLHTESTAKEPGAQVRANTSGKKSILDEVPYTMTGYIRFLDKDGYPGIKPPWGTLNAVDLNTGKLLWKVPLGEFEALKKRGIPPTGTQVYGGPVVTKGGLIFVASTQDEKIRAFDKKTGRQLWQAALPAAGYATPAVYSLEGRQYVVIACGGGKVGSKSGDTYVAFALPE